ncbi:hypothetical protein STREPTOSP366_23480 [Streptomyces variabilis]
MSEWIDPRYAELVAVWKRAQQPESRRNRGLCGGS